MFRRQSVRFLHQCTRRRQLNSYQHLAISKKTENLGNVCYLCTVHEVCMGCVNASKYDFENVVKSERNFSNDLSYSLHHVSSMNSIQ